MSMYCFILSYSSASWPNIHHMEDLKPIWHPPCPALVEWPHCHEFLRYIFHPNPPWSLLLVWLGIGQAQTSANPADLGTWREYALIPCRPGIGHQGANADHRIQPRIVARNSIATAWWLMEAYFLYLMQNYTSVVCDNSEPISGTPKRNWWDPLIRDHHTEPCFTSPATISICSLPNYFLLINSWAPTPGPSCNCKMSPGTIKLK